jgi:hypothetical protein
VGYTVLNNRVIKNNELRRKWSLPILGAISACAWRYTGKPHEISVRIASIWAETQNWHFPNMKQEY